MPSLAALAVWERGGIDAGIGYARLVLGRGAAEQDRLDDAVSELAAAEQALERAGDTWGLVRPINALGEVERARGQLVAARAHHRRALAICRELGDGSSLPSILCDIAHVRLDGLDLGDLGDQGDHGDLGDTGAAADAAEEALAIATELDNLVGITNALDALGRCRLAQGSPDAAVELWAEAQRLHEELGLPVERRDQPALARDLDAARITLGEDRFTHHWDIGIRRRGLVRLADNPK